VPCTLTQSSEATAAVPLLAYCYPPSLIPSHSRLFLANHSSLKNLKRYKLTAATHKHLLAETSLSIHTFVEREYILDDQPLPRNSGCRFLCIFRADDPSQVLPTCRTMCQSALVRDMNGTRKGKKCCISFVVTDVTRRDCRLATQIS
jgi:hypothetical protein